MRRIALLSLLVLPLAALAKGPGKPPETPKRPVTDTLQGTAVTDDYRWLEDATDPAVKAWSDAQNAYTRSYLDSRPSIGAIRARVSYIEKKAPAQYNSLDQEGTTLFAMKSQPPLQQPFLVVLSNPNDLGTERRVVDPNALDKTGSTTIDWYVPSHDGRRVAVSLSKGGSESGDVHIYDVATGKELGDVLPRVNGGTAGGSAAWNADGTGFWYTRYPRDGERPPSDLDFYVQVYYHRVGTSTDQDTYTLGKDFPKIGEVSLQTSDDGRDLLVNVANGDGGEHGFYLLHDGTWTHLAHFADGVVEATFGRDGSVWLLSRYGADKGRILHLPKSSPDLDAATVVVPEGDGVISSFVPMKSELYVVDLVGGPSRLDVFDLDGKAVGTVPIGDVASVAGLARLDGDTLLYRRTSYTDAPAWFTTTGTGDPAPTAMKVVSPVDFSDVDVVREMATSQDGTQVPLTILRPKGITLDGSHPTLLTGYGGYGVSQTPGFRAGWKVWLEQGGVIAVANLRGGGEFGEAWHTAGNLTHKQNVFDDFAACGQRLLDLGYTKPEHLAITGRSNGGLLMGAELVQHPDLWRAVVSGVGIYDMLRVELDPNGQFNTTEFGTVTNPAQFQALYAYSPYHHVVDGTKYPAVLFETGANNPRVAPYHSRKMTARLQAATASGYPVLLRTTNAAGHGMGSSLDERVAEQVDSWAFLFDQLGVAYKPVPTPK